MQQSNWWGCDRKSCRLAASDLLFSRVSLTRTALSYRNYNNGSATRAVSCTECGNRVCELGEACSSAASCNSTSLCPQDCPVSQAAHRCPTSKSLVGACQHGCSVGPPMWHSTHSFFTPSSVRLVSYPALAPSRAGVWGPRTLPWHRVGLL